MKIDSFDQHTINDVCTCHKVVFILSCIQVNLYYNHITCTSLVVLPQHLDHLRWHSNSVMILKITNILQNCIADTYMATIPLNRSWKVLLLAKVPSYPIPNYKELEIKHSS